MPRKNAKFSKKKRYTKRKFVKKSYKKRMPIRYNQSLGTAKPIIVTKIFQLSNLTVGAAAGAGAGYYLSFIPNTFPGWTSYSNLYEQFKLLKVKVRIEPTVNMNSMIDQTGATKMFINSIHSTIDYYNTAAPSSAGDLFNDSTYKRTRGTRNHVRTVYPKLVYDINESIIDTDNTTINKWFSISSTADASYLGLRVYIDPVSNVVAPIEYNCYYVMTIGFRNMKI